MAQKVQILLIRETFQESVFYRAYCVFFFVFWCMKSFLVQTYLSNMSHVFWLWAKIWANNTINHDLFWCQETIGMWWGMLHTSRTRSQDFGGENLVPRIIRRRRGLGIANNASGGGAMHQVHCHNDELIFPWRFALESWSARKINAFVKMNLK